MDALMSPLAKWPFARIGAAIAAAAAAIVTARAAEVPAWPELLACLLAYLGAITAGATVAARRGDAATLWTAAVTAALAAVGTLADWFAVRIVFEVAAGVAVVGAILVAVPRPVAFGAVSLLAVFHFCGVLSAIWSPAPSPWLVTQLWTRVFRFHLVFCYVNNAYQFYSPDPGPANLIWFCVESHDGDKAWFKLPKKPETGLDPMGVEYFRRLSITSACYQYNRTFEVPEFVMRRRTQRPDVPFAPYMPPARQYRVPYESSRKVIASCARHAADVYGGPDLVKSVKVYLVEHRMLDPHEFAARADPYDPSTYMPFYAGDYTPDGRLIDPNDPLLYWLVPVLREPPAPGSDKPGLFNGLKHHTGSDPFAA